MGKIKVHEFISLDGVIEDPRWTAEYPFDPKMADAIGRLTGESEAILLGRRTFEMFAPAWRDRTAEDDPGAPFFNETLFVFPLTLGAGQRLFGEGDAFKLAPAETEAYDSGVVHLAYRPAE